MSHALMHIEGQNVGAESGEFYDVVNPATGQLLAKVSKGGASDVSRAVDSAREAFDHGPWARMAPPKGQGCS